MATNAARDMAMATGSNTVAHGNKPQRVADGGVVEEKMAHVDQEEDAAGGARDIMLVKTETATRTATETEKGALATND
jgi:hypothetical protein